MKALFGLLVVGMLGITGYYTYSYVNEPATLPPATSSQSTSPCCPSSRCCQQTEATQECSAAKEAEGKCCQEGKEGKCCQEGKEGKCPGDK
jgi:hypothetical protein